MDPEATTALIDEALKKSGLVWVRVPGTGEHAQPVWHVWQDSMLYVLSGGLEQPVPEALTDRAFVTVRSKDKRSRLVTLEVDVAVVAPDSEEWTSLTPALLAKRLNLPDGDAAPQRWARECTLYRMTPTGAVAETPDEPSVSAHAAAPPPTRARTRVPRPLHLRGRPRVNKGGR